MGLFFVYILKSSACLAVFYLFYRLLLARETFHRFNRFALLGILLLSCLLPLIEVSVERETEMQQPMLTLEQLLVLADAADAIETEVAVETAAVTWVQVALLLYLAGIIFFALRNACSLVRLLMLLKSGEREEIHRCLPERKERVALIVHNREIAPFSWMNYIVISRKDLEENGREILIHELAHIRNRHSWDLLVADVCIFFQWFNPASWLLKQELQNIHEFEADETVIKEGVNAKQYQLLLIKKAVGTRLYSMANSFNHSKLKKRITMMMKEKSSPWARLKYLYVLPVAAVAVTAFARPEVSKVSEEISEAKVNDLAAIVETKVAESVAADTTKPFKPKYVPVEVKEQKEDKVYQVVGEMPEFPGGGVSAMMEFLKENMRYPADAKEKGMQGMVMVQFIIDKEGNVTNPKVLRSVDAAFDAEAIRLVSAMPKWKSGRQDGQPVAVKYTLPVKFRLDDASAGNGKLKSGTILINDNGEEPLYIVDGQEVTPSIMKALSPSRIEAFKVLKDKDSIEKYGEKGKNGVILITLEKEGAETKNRMPKESGKENAVTIVHSTPGQKIKIPGVGGVYTSSGKETTTDDMEVYVDGVKIDLKKEQLNTVVSPEDIAGVGVKKSEGGKGAIHVITKKNAAKTSAEGNMKVEGKVIDEQGDPIIGASVLIEGTKSGTVTGVDGNFTLSVPSKDAVLVVSYIGVATNKVKAQPKLTVTLKDE